MNSIAIIPRTGRADVRAFVALASLLSLGLLLTAALLRELPCFWTTAWGVPEPVRDLVREGFKPLLAGECLVLVLFGLTGGPDRLRTFCPRESLLLRWLSRPPVVLWLLFLVVVQVAVTDNLANLIAGQGFYFDAPMTCGLGWGIKEW